MWGFHTKHWCVLQWHPCHLGLQAGSCWWKLDAASCKSQQMQAKIIVVAWQPTDMAALQTHNLDHISSSNLGNLQSDAQAGFCLKNMKHM